MGSKPLENQRYVGVEIECFLPESLHPNLIERFGWLNGKAGFYHFDVGRDSSINPKQFNHIGIELRILAPVRRRKVLVEQACSILRDLRAEVNRSCGLHVHLDMRLTPKQRDKFRGSGDIMPSNFASRNNTRFRRSAIQLVKALPFLHQFVTKSRYNQYYCRDNCKYTSNSDRVFPELRYQAVNTVCAFNDLETIEVRMHQGTINAQKINDWIDLLESISKQSKSSKMEDIPGPDTAQPSARAVLEFLLANKMSERQVKYFMKRAGVSSKLVADMMEQME